MDRGLRSPQEGPPGLLCCPAIPQNGPQPTSLLSPWAHLPLNPGGPFLINKEKLLSASAEDLRRGQALRALPGAGVSPSEVVAGGNMGQLALEPHIDVSPSLGPCCLPSETPKSQAGSLLSCLSLSRRRASESSLSSQSSESSDAGEAQGYHGACGGEGAPESLHFTADQTNIFPTTWWAQEPAPAHLWWGSPHPVQSG